MWKPPPELGLDHIRGDSVPRNRFEALRSYTTTGEAGALGIELLAFDHAGFHPSYGDAARLMRNAASASGPGWELLQGFRSWREGSFEDAYSHITRAANREPFALAILGFMTERGVGVAASQQTALQLYIRAEDCPYALFLRADLLRRKYGFRSARRVVNGYPNDGLKCYLGETLMNDDPQAARRLFEGVRHDYGRVKMAEMFDRGPESLRNQSRAKQLYDEGISSGNSKAMCLQGIGWRKGFFGDVDVQKARDLFEMAADFQDTTAMVLLGSMYEHGMGAERDVSTAMRLYKNSSDMGDSYGYLSLAKMYLSRDEAEAKALLEKARLFGNDVVQCEALFELGRLYENGRGVERNYVTAFTLYRRCRRFGVTSTTTKAVTRIGFLFERGHGTKKCVMTAKACYEYAAGLEEGEAAYRLGLIAEHRDDPGNAAEWYLTGVSYGWVDAAYRLGRIVEEREISAAVECYRTAAELGCTGAQLRLGNMMLLGRGVDMDVEEGRSLLIKAAQGGSSRARRLLRELGSYLE